MNIKYLEKFFDNPTDYDINDVLDIRFIQPEASANFVHNPEIHDLTGYTSTAAMTLDETNQAHGLNSIRAVFTLNNTVFYTLPIELDGNTSYTFSLDILGEGNFELFFLVNGVQTGGYTRVTTTKYWDRYSHTIHLRNGVVLPSGTVVVGIRSLGSSTNNLDGWQVEPKPYATTFISGSKVGNFTGVKEYFWNGPAHQSVSTRLASTTTGGRIITLESTGVKLESVKGFGMLKVSNNAQKLASRQKSLYNCTNYEERDISLFVRIDSCDYKDYICKRNELLQLFAPNKTARAQPTRMLVRLVDCGIPQSKFVYLDVVYNGGLEGDFNNFYNEKVSVDLIAYDPVFKCLYEKSCVLTPSVSKTIQNNNMIISNNNVTGEWDDISSINRPTVFQINKAKVGPDGKLYATGTFVIGGQRFIAVRWTGTTWEGVGPGAPFTTILSSYDMAFIDNSIYFSGLFRGPVGGISDNVTGNGLNIIKYNIATNGVVKIGEIDGPTRGIATDGVNLFVGGQFNTVVAGTTLVANSVARYDTRTGTWSNMAGGFGLGPVANGGFYNNALPSIDTIALDQSGFAWYGGKFVVSNQRENVVRYNIAANTWLDTDSLTRTTSISFTPVNINSTFVSKILVNRRGQIFAAGFFDGSAASNLATTVQNRLDRPISIAIWNGTIWKPIDALLSDRNNIGNSNFPAIISDMVYDEIKGELHVIGTVSYAGKQYISPYDQNINPYTYNIPNNGNTAFTYNGSTWRTLPVDFDSTQTVEAGTFIALGSFFDNNTFSTALSGQTTGFGLPAELQSSFFLGVRNTAVNGTFQTPAITTCENGCADSSNVVITLIGAGKVTHVKNLTTDSAIYLSDYPIESGEVVQIDVRGIVPTFVPSYIKNEINTTSNLSSFNVNSGANLFEVFMTDTDQNTKAYVTWTQSYTSFDGICEDC